MRTKSVMTVLAMLLLLATSSIAKDEIVVINDTTQPVPVMVQNQITPPTEITVINDTTQPVPVTVQNQTTPSTVTKAGLLPGGNTIGGPGHITLAPDETREILNVSNPDIVDVCVTMVLIKGNIFISFGSGQSGLGLAPSVRTRCHKGADVVEAWCNAAYGPCELIWRVDKM